MTNVAFKLEDSGFTREQVEAITGYIGVGVATKVDIERLGGKLNLHSWMLGLILLTLVAPYLKAFFDYT